MQAIRGKETGAAWVDALFDEAQYRLLQHGALAGASRTAQRVQVWWNDVVQDRRATLKGRLRRDGKVRIGIAPGGVAPPGICLYQPRQQRSGPLSPYHRFATITVPDQLTPTHCDLEGWLPK